MMSSGKYETSPLVQKNPKTAGVSFYSLLDAACCGTKLIKRWKEKKMLAQVALLPVMLSQLSFHFQACSSGSVYLSQV